MNTWESLILDAKDLEFCLYDWLQVDRLTEHERHADHSRETFDNILDLTRALAEEYLEPHNRASDLDEPRPVGGEVVVHGRIKPALGALADTGLLAATMSEAEGGFGLPHVVWHSATHSAAPPPA